MLFNSLQFFVFFIIVTALYFALPHRFRWCLLLLASCYFYMVFVPAYILILGFTIVVDYFAGIYIERSHDKRRKLFLVCSLIANIGVLAVFKYYNFINNNLTVLLQGVGLHNSIPYLSILLPIGLSFHTFQAMSYTIEVYRGNQKAEKHFGIYALYVMFYPQLVAGPIERPQNLLHQFREEHHFQSDNFKNGLLLMAFGLFKKVVIADRLSIAVDHAFNNYQGQSGLSLTVAMFFYSFQIYCDFSGYSEMAIGAAEIMGFKLMTNFNAPYFSRSISEFWKRWHISLSTWFRDYLYITMGGNRVSNKKTYVNLFIVFVVSGLWHGANWTFVIWGALHGIFIMIEKWLNDMKIKIFRWQNIVSHWMEVFCTFCLATFAWIFFRAENYGKAIAIIHKIFASSMSDRLDLQLNHTELLFCFFLIALLLVKEKYFMKLHVQQYRTFLLLMIVLTASCYLFGVFNNKQFIYFQF